MNVLRMIEIFYNTSINKNYFINRDGIEYNGIIIKPYSSVKINLLAPQYSFSLCPCTSACVRNDLLEHSEFITADMKEYGDKTIPYYLARGTTKINSVFEYALRHDCFKDIFESEEFLNIVLNIDNHTFFEDEWFIKAFLKLENWFDRTTIPKLKVVAPWVEKDPNRYARSNNGYITLENFYTRISWYESYKPYDTCMLPVENIMTFKTLVKVSKSFIGKSTVKELKDKFDQAFDIFFDTVWKEYEHHNKLPF